MTQEPCILVIGAPRMALSLFCDRLPQAGETVSLKEHPLFEMGDRATALSVALTRLHARTVFCGVVGDDSMGRMMRDQLYAEGVDTRFLYTAPHTATGLECRLCGKTDETRGLQFAGVGRLLEKEQAEEAFACLPDAVCLLADLPPEILSHVMMLADDRHIPVIMDAAGARRGWAICRRQRSSAPTQTNARRSRASAPARPTNACAPCFPFRARSKPATMC